MQIADTLPGAPNGFRRMTQPFSISPNKRDLRAGARDVVRHSEPDAGRAADDKHMPASERIAGNSAGLSVRPMVNGALIHRLLRLMSVDAAIFLAKASSENRRDIDNRHRKI
jgi:hypothetical protein